MNTSVFFKTMFGASLFVLAWSCDSDKDSDPEMNADLNSTQMEEVIAADLVIEDTDMYFDLVMDMEANASDRPGEGSKRELPDCAVVTSTLTANLKTVTIDFGASCVFGEDELSGKITFVFERDPDAHQKSISKTFEAFSFNGKTINGTTSIVRVKSNNDGQPQSTKTIDLSLVLEDGTAVTKTGTKVKVFYFNPDAPKHKAKYTLTGNWELVFSDGRSKSVTVTSPLVRAARCKFFVSGTMDVVKSDTAFEVDFGDGSCDRKATLTFADGTTKDIQLKR